MHAESKLESAAQPLLPVRNLLLSLPVPISATSTDNAALIVTKKTRA